jgi:hypothetical protein
MNPSDLALSRLRDPENPALAALARLVVDETTRTPMRELASPAWLTSQLTAALEQARLVGEDRKLREWLPTEAEAPLRELLGREYAPSEPLTLRIVDQPAMRNLLKVVLSDTVTRFRRRVSDADAGMLGGLGKRAAARGRGFLGNLGGLAENLVDAVKEEVDHALEGRVGDFVNHATGEAVKTVARYLAEPSHAAQFSEMRLAVLDVLLDTEIRELAREGEKLGPEVAVDVVVASVRGMLAAPDFRERTEARIAAVIAEAGDGTFGAWLDEVGLHDVWRDTTSDLVAQRLRAVVGTPGFEAWWAGLFA